MSLSLVVMVGYAEAERAFNSSEPDQNNNTRVKLSIEQLGCKKYVTAVRME